MRGPARAAGIMVVGLAVAAGLFPASPERTPREDPERERERASEAGPDRIGPALEKRIRGRASLDDVRVDVEWPLASKLTSARVYGNGVGIWDRNAQFRLSRTEVVAILKALQKARLGAMPEQFGESEGEEKHEGPRLRGRVTIAAGEVSKSVIQLVDGEQSEALESLAHRVLAICAGPAKKGIGAASLADGLQKLASGALQPETLQVTVQRRFDRPDEQTGEAGWVLKLDGRRILDDVLAVGKAPPSQKLFVLSEADFRSLAELMEQTRAAEIPTNVFAPEYTDIQLAVLRWQRSLAARRFLEMTPETKGAAQKSFDRLSEAFRDLHRRARAEGTAVSTDSPP